MKKTSRRRFGKQFTGALAALPIASIALNTNAEGQSTLETQPMKAAIQQNRFHEDTPPPIEIIDGSLSFSIVNNSTGDLLTEKPQSSKEYWYVGDVNNTKSNKIEHIRVLHGSGVILYQDLNALGSTVSIDLDDTAGKKLGRLKFEGSQSEFKVTSTTDGSGNPKLKHVKPTSTTKPKHGFHHQGPATGSNEFRVSSITITKRDTSAQTFTAPDAANSFSQEYRVLIWLEE